MTHRVVQLEILMGISDLPQTKVNSLPTESPPVSIPPHYGTRVLSLWVYFPFSHSWETLELILTSIFSSLHSIYQQIQWGVFQNLSGLRWHILARWILIPWFASFRPEKETDSGRTRNGVRGLSSQSEVVLKLEEVMNKRMADVAGIRMEWMFMGSLLGCSVISTNLKFVKCCKILGNNPRPGWRNYYILQLVVWLHLVAWSGTSFF